MPTLVSLTRRTVHCKKCTVCIHKISRKFTYMLRIQCASVWAILAISAKARDQTRVPTSGNSVIKTIACYFCYAALSNIFLYFLSLDQAEQETVC